VCGFLNVFHEEFPRLTPDMEIEFSTDLVSNTQPISIHLYGMASQNFRY